MCRMGLISSKREIDLTEKVMVLSTYYSASQRDGFGYGYLKDNIPVVVKTAKPAMEFWIQKQSRIVSDNVIWHTRTQTSGGVSDKASHPFMSKDILLTHNGYIWNEEKLQKHLEKEIGLKFETTVDSEVLLKTIEAYGLKFPDILKKYDIGGSIVLQFEYEGNLYVYRNGGEYGLYEQKGVIFGASDNKVLPVKDIPVDTLIAINKGKILYKEKVASVNHISRYTYNYDIWENYEGGWTNYARKPRDRIITYGTPIIADGKYTSEEEIDRDLGNIEADIELLEKEGFNDSDLTDKAFIRQEQKRIKGEALE